MRFYPGKVKGGQRAKALELVERRKNVMQLFRQRYSHREIAELLGIDRTAVSADIRAMMQMLEQEGIKDAAIVRVRELMDLDVLEREALYRLEKLKKNPHQGSRWAEIVLSCKERRAKLLGLDAEQKFSLKTSVEILTKDQKDAIFYAALGGHVPVEMPGPEGEKLIEMKPIDKPALIDEALDTSKDRQAEIKPLPTVEERAVEAIEAMYAPADYSPLDD